MLSALSGLALLYYGSPSDNKWVRISLQDMSALFRGLTIFSLVSILGCVLGILIRTGRFESSPASPTAALIDLARDGKTAGLPPVKLVKLQILQNRLNDMGVTVDRNNAILERVATSIRRGDENHNPSDLDRLKTIHKVLAESRSISEKLSIGPVSLSDLSKQIKAMHLRLETLRRVQSDKLRFIQNQFPVDELATEIAGCIGELEKFGAVTFATTNTNSPSIPVVLPPGLAPPRAEGSAPPPIDRNLDGKEIAELDRLVKAIQLSTTKLNDKAQQMNRYAESMSQSGSLRYHLMSIHTTVFFTFRFENIYDREKRPRLSTKDEAAKIFRDVLSSLYADQNGLGKTIFAYKSELTHLNAENEEETKITTELSKLVSQAIDIIPSPQKIPADVEKDIESYLNSDIDEILKILFREVTPNDQGRANVNTNQPDTKPKAEPPGPLAPKT